MIGDAQGDPEMDRIIMRFSLVFALAALGCATQPPPAGSDLVTSGDYTRLVENHTDTTKSYDGFMNILDISATELTSAVQLAQVDQYARVYQWNPEQYRNEKEKVRADFPKQTEIFLSFFVPDRKHDDLEKSHSKWKIFLDVGDKRYEGKATRVKGLLAELQILYPHHTRWHTAYRLTFPVPVTQVETQPTRLVLTGPVASANLDFNRK